MSTPYDMSTLAEVQKKEVKRPRKGNKERTDLVA